LCVKHDILATLSYFDIFDYPLTQIEITQFLKNTYSQREITRALNSLSLETWIYKFDELYTLQNNHALINRRREGNKKARNMLKTAQKIAGFLSAFPFVKGIAVSGSLSKNCADEKADIDFFIITEANRLWLARTFMMLFRKLAVLFKKQDWFCMNYYVDETALEIEEKNIYTAIEIATLLPFRGNKPFQEFFKQNNWTKNLLPNHTLRVSYVEETRNPFFKRFVEFLLRNRLGDLLGYVFMKWTDLRYKKKEKRRKVNEKGWLISLIATKHCAKMNPALFQKSIVDTYQKKIFNLFRRYENNTKNVL